MQLAQCPRCQRYGWKGVVTGFNVLADATPLTTPEQFRDALLSQLAIYEIKGIAGADAKYLKVVSPKNLDGKRKAGATLVADHGCGAPARDAVPVEVTHAGPQSAPVTPGRPADGFRPPHAPGSGSQGHAAPSPLLDLLSAEVGSLENPLEAAKHAIPHRSKPTRCGTCRKLITGDELGIIGVQYDGRWQFAWHEAC